MQQKLIKWFKEHKRDLPWRDNPSPYHVWVSEIMLQQTQVAVVIPYYLRWMERFPTIKALAEADSDVVIKMWEGLGYYSRARNLHLGAKQVCESNRGVLTDVPEELAKIKGIGPYTQGAILSFAFNKRAAAVDGNVIRVLSRYLCIEEDISKPSTIKTIWKHAESLLPDQESWVFNEGLIELGATICTKNPQCLKCPIKSSCKGFSKGVVKELPFKSKKQVAIELFRKVAVIECEGFILVRKCPKGEIMQDLFEFPFQECAVESDCSKLSVEWIKKKFDLSVTEIKTLTTVSHGFTKYRVKLFPSLYSCVDRKPVPEFQWVQLDQLSTLPFNSGHRRIVVKNELESYFAFVHGKNRYVR